MPGLLQTLSLACDLKIDSDFDFDDLEPLGIKPEYIKLIRKAHFEFRTECWEIPYRELTSLEVLQLECSDDFGSIMWEARREDYVQWAAAQDFQRYLADVRRHILWDNSDSVREMLQDESRNFKVQWTDHIFDRHADIDTVSHPHSSHPFLPC